MENEEVGRTMSERDAARERLIQKAKEWIKANPWSEEVAEDMADFALQETAELRLKCERYEAFDRALQSAVVRVDDLEFHLMRDDDLDAEYPWLPYHASALDAFDAIHGKDERMKEEG